MPRASKLEGAISGRALYDGRLDAGEALALIATGSALSFAICKVARGAAS